MDNNCQSGVADMNSSDNTSHRWVDKQEKYNQSQHKINAGPSTPGIYTILFSKNLLSKSSKLIKAAGLKGGYKKQPGSIGRVFLLHLVHITYSSVSTRAGYRSLLTTEK
jgi:hypothetical protein